MRIRKKKQLYWNRFHATSNPINNFRFAHERNTNLGSLLVSYNKIMRLILLMVFRGKSRYSKGVRNLHSGGWDTFPSRLFQWRICDSTVFGNASNFSKGRLKTKKKVSTYCYTRIIAHHLAFCNYTWGSLRPFSTVTVTQRLGKLTEELASAFQLTKFGEGYYKSGGVLQHS